MPEDANRAIIGPVYKVSKRRRAATGLASFLLWDGFSRRPQRFPSAPAPPAAFAPSPVCRGNNRYPPWSAYPSLAPPD